MQRAAFLVMAMVGGYACSSCYHLPTWEGDVQVTARERASLKTCGTGALTDAGKAAIARWPYIQSTTINSTTVAWRSRDGKGEVALRTADGKEVARIKAVPAGEPDVVKASFIQLEPTTMYCYQLYAGEVALTEAAPLTTATAPDSTEPTYFVAIGDSGNGGAAEKAIVKRMTAERFDFIVHLGDLAYEEGSPLQIENYFFTIFRELLRYVPVFPTIGNHERVTKNGAPYFEAFVLPGNERYYSYDWGDVHLVAIDTTLPDPVQLAWLASDLERNKRAWTIVYGHHPMYTNSLRGPSPRLRRAFANLITTYKVDLFLAGHEHQYERFNVSGVNYVVSGGGGGQLTRIFGRSRAIIQATVHHFLAFEVTASVMNMRVIGIDGRVLDTLRLTKSDAANTATR